MEIGKDYIGVGVGAVILNEKFEILLLKRKKNPEVGKWSIPGGKIDMMESAEDAIMREVKEELGVDVKVKMLLGFTSHIIKEENEHWVAPAYLVRIVEGSPENLEPDKHDEIKWFCINDLPENVTITTEKSLEYLGRFRALFNKRKASEI